MDRDEFMELIYETFADEPDNVLANGIIEAADAYVEHEKAQLSQEDATSDLISRTETVEHLRRMLEATVPNTDHDEGYVDGVEFGISTVSTMPTIQPEPQWIPVERELPEDFTDVLVWFEYFRYGDYNCLYQTHGIGTYVANYNLWTVNHETGWKDLRVIAWMPLPEAYKPNK